MDSQESSPAPQFKGINSSALFFLYSPALTTVCYYWEEHSLGYMDLYQESNVSALHHTVMSSDLMAAVTIRSDFRAQEEEICHYFHLFPRCGGGLVAKLCPTLAIP